MEKVVAIIQARMGSTRLPGKVMKKIAGTTVLSHVIQRIRQSKLIDEIIVATSILEQDDVLAKEAVKCGIKSFRGSEDDVLSRYYHAAKNANADVIVRITSDCPLIDPFVVDDLVKYYKENDYDMVTNAGLDLSQRTYPRGLDTEVFSFEILEEAFNTATKDYQREHVTPYIYENSNKIYYYKNHIDYSDHRWTLDTEEDFVLISKIYECLYKGQHNFYMADILRLFEQKPELKRINAHVEQRRIK